MHRKSGPLLVKRTNGEAQQDSRLAQKQQSRGIFNAHPIDFIRKYVTLQEAGQNLCGSTADVKRYKLFIQFLNWGEKLEVKCLLTARAHCQVVCFTMILSGKVDREPNKVLVSEEDRLWREELSLHWVTHGSEWVTGHQRAGNWGQFVGGTCCQICNV